MLRLLLFATLLFCANPAQIVHAQLAIPAQIEEATAIYDGFKLEYYVPAAPRNVAVEAAGKVWFTSPDADGIGLVEVLSDLEETMVRYRVTFYATGRGSMPYDLDYADGLIWFTLREAGQIGRMNTTTRELTLFNMPSPGDKPTGIDTGSGLVWVGTVGGLLLSFNPTSTTFTAYPTEPGFANNPRIEDVRFQDIRSIWYSMPDEDAMGEFTAIGERHFKSPTPARRPVGIAGDSAGRIWVAAKDASQILRLVGETRGDWIAYDTPAPNSGPSHLAIVNGPKGREVWFTDYFRGTASRLRFNASGELLDRETSRLAASGARPFGIVAGPDLHLWVTDLGRGVIYELTPPYIFKQYIPLLQ